MAIIGGAGNPVGGSFTGPAQALEIVGDFGYAASGSIQDAGSDAPDTTLLSFTTGNYVFVGTMDFTTTLSSATSVYLDVSFNGGLVSETKQDASNYESNQPMKFHYIIPPYTEVSVKWGAGGTFNGSVFMAGRIYRTRD